MDASGRRRVRRLNFDLHVHHITSASNKAAHTLAVASAILPSSIVPKSSSSRTKSIGGGGIGGGGGGDVVGVDEDDPAGAAAASTAAVASVLNVVSFAESTPGTVSSSAIGSTADSDFTTSTPFAFSEFTAADSLLSLTVDELNTSSTSYVVAESRRRPDDAAVATHAPSLGCMSAFVNALEHAEASSLASSFTVIFLTFSPAIAASARSLAFFFTLSSAMSPSNVSRDASAVALSADRHLSSSPSSCGILEAVAPSHVSQLQTPDVFLA